MSRSSPKWIWPRRPSLISPQLVVTSKVSGPECKSSKSPPKRDPACRKFCNFCASTSSILARPDPPRKLGPFLPYPVSARPIDSGHWSRWRESNSLRKVATQLVGPASAGKNRNPSYQSRQDGRDPLERLSEMPCHELDD